MFVRAATTRSHTSHNREAAIADNMGYHEVMRTEQPEGSKGSLKWIQRAVNDRWPSLNDPIVARTGSDSITWLSPLASDNFAEYRDGAFVRQIGQPQLEDALAAYWPARGPQWDALGVTSSGGVLLVEAKAHIAEMCSPGTAAAGESRKRIKRVLDAEAVELGADPKRADWAEHFYQLANRLAHLHFLRKQGVEAWLVLVGFLGDREMRGPTNREAWEAAYEVAFHVMGLHRRHALAPHVVHVHPSVPDMSADCP